MPWISRKRLEQIEMDIRLITESLQLQGTKIWILENGVKSIGDTLDKLWESAKKEEGTGNADTI